MLYKTSFLTNFHLIVCNTEENPEREEACLKALDQQMVAGLILSPVPGEARHLTKYTQHGLKFITFNRRLDHLPDSSVTADDDKAAFDCVRHLIKEGRTRIAATIILVIKAIPPIKSRCRFPKSRCSTNNGR